MSSFSNLSVALPTAHSPTIPLLHLHHSSFSNPSLSLLLRHRLFTYVTWRAAHGIYSHRLSKPTGMPNHFVANLIVTLQIGLLI